MKTRQTNRQQLLTMSSDTKGRQDKLSLPIILNLAVYCACMRKDKPVQKVKKKILFYCYEILIKKYQTKNINTRNFDMFICSNIFNVHEELIIPKDIASPS